MSGFLVTFAFCVRVFVVYSVIWLWRESRGSAEGFCRGRVAEKGSGEHVDSEGEGLGMLGRMGTGKRDGDWLLLYVCGEDVEGF